MQPPLRSGAAAFVCVLSYRVFWVSPGGCRLLSSSSGIPGRPCSGPSSDVYIPWVYIGRTFVLGWRCFADRVSVKPFAGLFSASQLMSPFALHTPVSFLSRSSPRVSSQIGSDDWLGGLFISVGYSLGLEKFSRRLVYLLSGLSPAAWLIFLACRFGRLHLGS